MDESVSSGVLLDIMLCYHRIWWRRRYFLRADVVVSSRMFSFQQLREIEASLCWCYKVAVTLCYILYTAITSKASRLYRKLSPSYHTNFPHTYIRSRVFPTKTERERTSERVWGRQGRWWFFSQQNFSLWWRKKDRIQFSFVRWGSKTGLSQLKGEVVLSGEREKKMCHS